MIRSIWTYPWDVLDVGRERFYNDVFDRAGLNSISLALSYHAGRFVQPRSPKRKVYFPEDGTLYFRVEQARYEHHRIQPKTVSYVDECHALLRELEADKRSKGFRLSAWFVCLHNTRIGMDCPEATVVNAFGDHYFHSLCPSNDINRTYIKAALKDLTDNYEIDAVELESLSFMGFPHEYHHEKDGVSLNRYEQFLMSICFCNSCKERANSHNVDIEWVQSFVQAELNTAFTREVPLPVDPDFTAQGMAYFSKWPVFYQFLQWRNQIVTELTCEVRQAVNPRTDVIILSLATDSAWTSGVDVGQIADVCDGVLVCCYDTDAERVKADTAQARGLIPLSKQLFTGFRVFYPEVQSGGDLAAKISATVEAGAEGVNFYNYGLIPEARLDWIAATSALPQRG